MGSKPSPWNVHKFGGTSVLDASRIRGAARIALEQHRGSGAGARTAIVVSAMGGVTDALIKVLDGAKSSGAGNEKALDAVMERHRVAVADLFAQAPGIRKEQESALQEDAKNLGDVLRAVSLGKGYSEAVLELFSGYGELWSARMMAAHLALVAEGSDGGVAPWVDARTVLVVEQTAAGPAVQWDRSQERMDGWLKSRSERLAVVTGYVASTPDGAPTTLKRNGSDFSAAIFGRLLNARAVVIWTDVDGVLSADPRRVPDAVVLPEMSYEEALELAYFGAKVLHPGTIAPAAEAGIPLWIRNTLRPEARGTCIGPRKPGKSDLPVKGFSTVDQVALLSVQGTGLMGVPGVAERVFGALRDVGVSVILISQASSEHSICFAVPEDHGVRARDTLQKAFFGEIHHGLVDDVVLIPGCSVLAAVGDAMVERPGVAGRFLSSLGRAGVSVRAIAQGSSERNISVVIDRDASNRALQAAHAGFFLSDQTLSVGVVGVGGIGAALLEQLRTQGPALRGKYQLDLRVRAVADSKRMLLAAGLIDLSRWREELAAKGESLDLARFAAHLRSGSAPHAVAVDCTASETVARAYPGWLKGGIHVVTPNKKAGSSDQAFLREIREAAEIGHARWFYEGTVGAGLPVISTLKELLRTGDRIIEVQGVFSGTLSYIFGAFKEGAKFSDVVGEAKRRGYTEPDPRDDLSGRDVARKLIILAREMELDMELGQIPVESLVPAELEKLKSPDEFMKRLPEFDAAMEARAAKARAAGKVLRYVGAVSVGQQGKAEARVELREFPLGHPLAGLEGGDNLILFRTTRYDERPLVVRGPGAGPQVTAGGVFGDLLRLAAYLGAPV